jgi:hypothetical protein
MWDWIMDEKGFGLKSSYNNTLNPVENIRAKATIQVLAPILDLLQFG